jgi:malate permease and related proteins
MTPFLIIILFLSLGFISQRLQFLPRDTAKYLTNYLIYLVLPAMALFYIPKLLLSLDFLIPISSAWICFLLSWLIFGYLGKKFNWDRETIGCLIIVSGLSNTSFVGFPIIQSLYGDPGIEVALLIDQGGSFILVSSLAVLVASIYSSEQRRKRDIGFKIFSFPPFVFFLLAIFLNVMEFDLPQQLQVIFKALVSTLSPVALFTVGMRINFTKGDTRDRFLWYGLGYKLMLIPLITFLIFKDFFEQNDLWLQVPVMETGMAPMITGSLVAISHQLNPKLASIMVGLGIPLSFVTLAFWYLLMNQF